MISLALSEVIICCTINSGVDAPEIIPILPEILLFIFCRESASEIKVLYKTLGSDESKDFDEKGFSFFNTTGTTDTTVKNSLSDADFQEYNYSAGVTDDGVGEPLPEFSQFQIKIVMQGTDAANPPRIKDLRIIALAT